MSEPIKIDGRREAGERTRQRLLDATRVLLAERGEDAVTLRDITDAADANVAAVSYHFGSLTNLIRATVEQALAALIDGQTERLRALPEDPLLEEIAGALAHLVVATAAEPGCEERALLRIMARVLADPPAELAEWLAGSLAREDAELLPRLRHALPGVPEHELMFRRDSAVGIFNFLVTGKMRVDLSERSPEEIERLLVPVITGVLAGGAPVSR